VVLGRPAGLLQSDGGCSAAAMTRWWSSSGFDRARCPKNLNRHDWHTQICYTDMQIHMFYASAYWKQSPVHSSCNGIGAHTCCWEMLFKHGFIERLLLI